MDSIIACPLGDSSATQAPSALTYETIAFGLSTPPKNTNAPISEECRSPNVVKFSPEKGRGDPYNHVIEAIGEENYAVWIDMFDTIKTRLGAKLDDAAQPHVYAVDGDRVEIHFGSGDISDTIIAEKGISRTYTHCKNHIAEMFLSEYEYLEIDFSDKDKLVVNWGTANKLLF